MPDETHPANDGSQAWIEDLIGKGKGDPDFYPDPGEAEALKEQSKNENDTLALIGQLWNIQV